MRVQAIYKNFRMSPQKMREMVRQIRPAGVAGPGGARRGAAQVGPSLAKTLNSAIANAENNNLKVENLRTSRR